MKKRRFLLSSICLTALCLVTAEEAGFPPWPEYYANRTPESIAFKRDAFRDPAKLKSELLQSLSINGRFDFKEFPWFKSTFDVQDEVLRPVLLEIYKEARMKNLDDPNNSVDMLRAKRSLTGLGLCADDDAKQLLLGIASQPSDVMDIRMRALAAYLQASSAEEAKTVLLRFLVEGERMDSESRSGVCRYALAAFKDASPEKKAAILEALYVALSREDNKWLFRIYDDILCKISKEYANSHQRLAILKRLINAPSLCKVDDYAVPELQEKLKALQKIRLSTNISTNLATLKARNFNLPQPDLSTNSVAEIDQQSAATGSKASGAAERGFGIYAFLGIPVILLLGFGAWKLRRR